MRLSTTDFVVVLFSSFFILQVSTSPAIPLVMLSGLWKIPGISTLGKQNQDEIFVASRDA